MRRVLPFSLCRCVRACMRTSGSPSTWPCRSSSILSCTCVSSSGFIRAAASASVSFYYTRTNLVLLRDGAVGPLVVHDVRALQHDALPLLGQVVHRDENGWCQAGVDTTPAEHLSGSFLGVDGRVFGPRALLVRVVGVAVLDRSPMTGSAQPTIPPPPSRTACTD